MARQGLMSLFGDGVIKKSDSVFVSIPGRQIFSRPIELPPLRKRKEDIVPLARHFIKLACRQLNCQNVRLTKSHVRHLRSYDWPGNVRELQNVIERAVILSKGSALRLDLSLPESAAVSEYPGASIATNRQQVLTEKQMRELQKQNLIAALKQTKWRVSGEHGAAGLLGIKPTTLTDRIKSFGIIKPRK